MKMKILFGVLVVCLLAGVVSGQDWDYGSGAMQSGSGVIVGDGDTVEMEFRVYDGYTPSDNLLLLTIYAGDYIGDLDTELDINCNNPIADNLSGWVFEWFTGADDTNLSVGLGLADTWVDDGYAFMFLSYFPLEGANSYLTPSEVGNISRSMSCNFTADGEELFINFLSSVNEMGTYSSAIPQDAYATPNEALDNIVSKIDEFIGIVFDIAEMIAILISIFIVVIAVIIPYKLFIYVTRKD